LNNVNSQTQAIEIKNINKILEAKISTETDIKNQSLLSKSIAESGKKNSQINREQL
jgi:hypothetical protein